MTYPQTIQEFRDALLAYDAPVEAAEAIEAAKMRTSIVDQAVGVFNALRGLETLSNESLGLALGAAHLIASGSWHGLGPDAVAFGFARAGELT
jgi:hypothetical protein